MPQNGFLRPQSLPWITLFQGLPLAARFHTEFTGLSSGRRIGLSPGEMTWSLYPRRRSPPRPTGTCRSSPMDPPSMGRNRLLKARKRTAQSPIGGLRFRAGSSGTSALKCSPPWEFQVLGRTLCISARPGRALAAYAGPDDRHWETGPLPSPALLEVFRNHAPPGQIFAGSGVTGGPHAVSRNPGFWRWLPARQNQEQGTRPGSGPATRCTVSRAGFKRPGGRVAIGPLRKNRQHPGQPESIKGYG